MPDAQANRMTKAERGDLLSLVKKRERVMKTMAAERSAEMIAEFEAQAAKIYSFNDDAVWQKAARKRKLGPNGASGCGGALPSPRHPARIRANSSATGMNAAKMPLVGA